MHVPEFLESHQRVIIALCTRAFEEDMSNLFEVFDDSTHILYSVNGHLVSHVDVGSHTFFPWESYRFVKKSSICL